MPRPRKDIDVELLKDLCAIHCTMPEICDILQVHEATLYRRFAGVMSEARSGGKMSLRRKRWHVAMDGNVPMLIWLSKVVLGEKDRVEHSIAEMPEEAFSQLVQQVGERIKREKDVKK